jgi:hypothetical protein
MKWSEIWPEVLGWFVVIVLGSVAVLTVLGVPWGELWRILWN